MLIFFPRDVLDEILNLIESVSEGFPTYTYDTKPMFISFDDKRFHDDEMLFLSDIKLENR